MIDRFPDRRCFRDLERAGIRSVRQEGRSDAEDGASGQMGSSVCQGGIDAVSWGLTAAVIGDASQSDSAAR